MAAEAVPLRPSRARQSPAPAPGARGRLFAGPPRRSLSPPRRPSSPHSHLGGAQPADPGRWASGTSFRTGAEGREWEGLLPGRPARTSAGVPADRKSHARRHRRHFRAALGVLGAAARGGSASGAGRGDVALAGRDGKPGAVQGRLWCCKPTLLSVMCALKQACHHLAPNGHPSTPLPTLVLTPNPHLLPTF